MNPLVLKAGTVARYFLGLVFFVFGLNGFLQFIPAGPMPGPAGKFVMALIESGYLFSFVKGTEVVVGALLLSGFYVPLALVLLAPISLNILLFHVFLVPAPALPLLIIAAQLLLAYVHRDAYAALLVAKAKPGRQPAG